MTENLPTVQVEKDNYVFASESSFVAAQRMAAPLAQSNLVPADYRGNLGNCLIALEISQRLKASPLLIMQNLYVIEGRPSWSAQFLIATINACGRYSPLRFAMKDLGEREVECIKEYKWEKTADGKNKKTPIMGKITIQDKSCTAWAIERETGERLESSEISVGMAVKEGWYQKNGSKWQTMPEQMLRYRAASFFARIYSPELTMGMQTTDEVSDMAEIKDVTPSQTSTQTSSINDILKTSATETYDAETGEVAEDSAKNAHTPTTEDSSPVDDKPLAELIAIPADTVRTGAELQAATKLVIAHMEKTELDNRQTILDVFEPGLLKALADKGLGRSHGDKILKLLGE